MDRNFNTVVIIGARVVVVARYVHKFAAAVQNGPEWGSGIDFNTLVVIAAITAIRAVLSNF
jgi:hypothetical protein